MKITLRPNQKKILEYRSGMMGISAVPGSGKTWTLSLLAAQIVASNDLADDQDVLVVTLVNSAVDNFYQRVSAFVDTWGLLPYMGFRVRTLHGLAHDIVRERPALVGLDERFQIVDEREANAICNEAARAWLREHPYELDEFLDPDLEDNRRDWVRRERLPELANSVAQAFVRYAKDLRLTPDRLRARLDGLPVPLPLAEMGWAIYADYQRALAYRGAVDFDDLIRLALQCLDSAPDYLERLRYRWPYILEDEAQDSSRLQEQILEKLAGEGGNWVRVGDPNQAIYETFTTANPRFLRAFIRRSDVAEQELPNSGRSTLSIIDLANGFVEWTMNHHPVEEVRDALHAPPKVEPTPEGDPQPNPADDPKGIYLADKRYTPQEEVLAVADSLQRCLVEHSDWTVAALAPRNLRGFDLVDELRRRGIPYEDSLLRSSSSTRLSAGVLANLMRYLADPGSASKLSTVYRVWRRTDLEEAETKKEVERIASLLNKLPQVEDYLWPGATNDWLAQTNLENEDPQVYASLVEFRRLAQRWQEAILLPIDQMILTLAQDLLSEVSDLALAHKLAVLLRRAEQDHPDWRLPEFTGELAVIARNERRFLGFGEDDMGFDPEKYKGRVVVATMHKAKGLEWDRVYLMSVNNYDFPSAQASDQYIAEKWFLRDQLNLEAETLGQLETALSTDEYQWRGEGTASREARLDYVRERLRLLYVGVTRARRELVITWNTGRKGDLYPAIPLEALQGIWDDILSQRGIEEPL